MACVNLYDRNDPPRTDKAKGIRDIDGEGINNLVNEAGVTLRFLGDSVSELMERGLVVTVFGISIPINLGPKDVE